MHMHYIRIFKTSYYVKNCSSFPNVAKELIPKTFPLRSTFDESCDI